MMTALLSAASKVSGQVNTLRAMQVCEELDNVQWAIFVEKPDKQHTHLPGQAAQVISNCIANQDNMS